MGNIYYYFKKHFVLIYILMFSGIVFSTIASGKYKCVGVSDGDTIWLMTQKGKIRVKIDGIDCPELGQDFGRSAKQFTSDLVLGKVIEVNIKGIDESKTPIAYVLVNKSDVGLELLGAGLAWNIKRFKSDDSVYAYIEQDAKERKVGLWSNPNSIAPWEFRKDAYKLIDDKSSRSNSAPSIETPSSKINPINIGEGTSQTNKKNVEALKVFILEIEDIVKTDMKQLENRWDQFVSACLINSDSKKYLYERKWFQFYEDLKNEKADVSLVYKLKYYDNPTCISYETEIRNLIISVIKRILNAEKIASSSGVYAIDILSIEKNNLIDRREWKNIELKEIIKQKDIRDYKW